MARAALLAADSGLACEGTPTLVFLASVAALAVPIAVEDDCVVFAVPARCDAGGGALTAPVVLPLAAEASWETPSGLDVNLAFLLLSEEGVRTNVREVDDELDPDTFCRFGGSGFQVPVVDSLLAAWEARPAEVVGGRGRRGAALPPRGLVRARGAGAERKRSRPRRLRQGRLLARVGAAAGAGQPPRAQVRSPRGWPFWRPAFRRPQARETLAEQARRWLQQQRRPSGLAAAMASQSGKSNPPPAPMTRTQPASCSERVPPLGSPQ